MFLPAFVFAVFLSGGSNHATSFLRRLTTTAPVAGTRCRNRLLAHAPSATSSTRLRSKFWNRRTHHSTWPAARSSMVRNFHGATRFALRPGDEIRNVLKIQFIKHRDLSRLNGIRRLREGIHGRLRTIPAEILLCRASIVLSASAPGWRSSNAHRGHPSIGQPCAGNPRTTPPSPCIPGAKGAWVITSGWHSVVPPAVHEICAAVLRIRWGAGWRRSGGRGVGGRRWFGGPD